MNIMNIMDDASLRRYDHEVVAARYKAQSDVLLCCTEAAAFGLARGGVIHYSEQSDRDSSEDTIAINDTTHYHSIGFNYYCNDGEEMAMGKDESIECTTSMPVLVPQSATSEYNSTPWKRGTRQPLGVTRGLEQPSRLTTPNSVAHRRCRNQNATTAARDLKELVSNSRSASQLRSETSPLPGSQLRKRQVKRRSISSETVVTVVSKEKVTVNSLRTGLPAKRC
jgi:hypothetical protein